jgi:hypothetical protein
VGQDPIERAGEPPVGLAGQEHEGGHDGHTDQHGVDEDPAGKSQRELKLARLRRSQSKGRSKTAETAVTGSADSCAHLITGPPALNKELVGLTRSCHQAVI